MPGSEYMNRLATIRPDIRMLPRLSILNIYVTGFWKTDQNVTLGLFDFIGPANGYTHTIHIHSVITRLS